MIVLIIAILHLIPIAGGSFETHPAPRPNAQKTIIDGQDQTTPEARDACKTPCARPADKPGARPCAAKDQVEPGKRKTANALSSHDQGDDVCRLPPAPSKIHPVQPRRYGDTARQVWTSDDLARPRLLDATAQIIEKLWLLVR